MGKERNEEEWGKSVNSHSSEHRESKEFVEHEAIEKRKRKRKECDGTEEQVEMTMGTKEDVLIESDIEKGKRDKMSAGESRRSEKAADEKKKAIKGRHSTEDASVNDDMTAKNQEEVK